MARSEKLRGAEVPQKDEMHLKVGMGKWCQQVPYRSLLLEARVEKGARKGQASCPVAWERMVPVD